MERERRRGGWQLRHQSQYLIWPSQEQVATLLVSRGCHSQPMSTWSWHFMDRTICRRKGGGTRLKGLVEGSGDAACARPRR